MINKIFLNIKNNFKFLFFLIILFIILNIKLPYTIDTTGGYINVSERIEINNSYKSSGSFNMAYVNEVDATIGTYLISLFNPDWDAIKNEDVLMDNETISDLLYRNKLALQEANNNAIVNAYRYAGKEYEIKNSTINVVYIFDGAKTNLLKKDVLLKVEDKKIEEKKDLIDYINTLNVGDKVKITVLRKDKEVETETEIIEIDSKKALGISVYEIFDVTTNPSVKIKTEEDESGPSGGLMTSLAIYNSLIEEDLTHGNKIVGTGTIDKEGNVGSIGGVKYKLLGAIKNKAKVFIIPNGQNYEEAKKIIEEKKYNIKLVGVSTFEDAVKFLEGYER